MLRLGGKSSGAEKRVNARLGGGTRAVLRVAGDRFSNGVDRMGTVRVHRGRFRPFTFHVGGSTLPRLIKRCSFARRHGNFYRSVSSMRRTRTLELTFDRKSVAKCEPLVGTLRRKCARVNFGHNQGVYVRLGGCLVKHNVVIGRSGDCRCGPGILRCDNYASSGRI